MDKMIPKNEHLSEFEKRRIIGIMEAGWSARKISRVVVRSDFSVKSIVGTSLIRRPVSGCPRQTNRREDSHIKRHACSRKTNIPIDLWPDTSSTFITGPCVFPNHRKVLG
ncbi:hypothetical protein TNCV_3515671 [Trichonephila clavipes]|nr:hypothetical protein TNCV_3515671 [Trichonephila clavipes]